MRSGESRVPRGRHDVLRGAGEQCQPNPVGSAMRQTTTQVVAGVRGQSEAPAVIPMFAASGAGAWSSPLREKKVSTRRHNHDEEGTDVHESTRRIPGSDSGTEVSAVNITPASSDPAPVTTTHTVA